MTDQQSQAVQNSIAAILTTIAKLERCLASPADNDTIMAWDTGLAVRLVDGEPQVVGCVLATAFPAVGPVEVYTNGAKQAAKRQRRGDVATRGLEEAKGMLAQFRAL